jgi:SAM-dependent methyltransferase
MTSNPSSRPLFDDPAAYDAFMGRYSGPLAEGFAQAGGVRPGERILDVGCGTGALAAALAAIVGADQVSAVEPSEPFAEAARRRVPGADVRSGPAEALPFPDRSFDRSLSQLVFHFVNDPASAAAEMARVTEPGGTVAACVWDMTGGMTMIRAYWDAAREADPKAPDEIERFGGRPGQLAELWRTTGLRDVEDGMLTVSSSYRDFDELWDSFMGAVGPVGVHAASLDGAARDGVRAALWRNVGSPEGPFELEATAWLVTGIV